MDSEIEQIEKIYNIVAEFLVEYSFQLLGAILVFLVGLYVANKVSGLLQKICKKKDIDITLANFISAVVKIIIIVMVSVICLGKLGISVSPFVAAIGAASLGVGLALQGALSNYSAGLTIIVARPFVVNDTISVEGVSGIVKEVKLAATILTDEDGVEITIPNKHIIGEVIKNSFSNSLAEGCIGISYDSDPSEAISIVKGVLDKNPKVSKKSSPQVGINNFADSSIEINYRYWIPTENYYKLKYQINLDVFEAIKEAKINIPFPQREVRML